MRWTLALLLLALLGTGVGYLVTLPIEQARNEHLPTDADLSARRFESDGAVTLEGLGEKTTARPGDEGATQRRARAWRVSGYLRVADPNRALEESYGAGQRATESGDPAYAGIPVMAFLRRGAEVRALARGVTDANARFHLRLPGVEALRPLARGATELIVLPVSRAEEFGEALHSLAYPRRSVLRLPAIPASSERELRLPVFLIPEGVAHGIVVGSDRDPVEGAEAWLVRGDGNALLARTTAAGRFHFVVPLAGVYRLKIEGADGQAAELRDLRLSPGVTYDLGTIPLRGSSNAIEVHLTYPDGGPVADALVEVNSDASPFVVGLDLSRISVRERAGARLRGRTGDLGFLRVSWPTNRKLGLSWDLRVKVKGLVAYRRPPRSHDGMREPLRAVVSSQRLRVRIVDRQGLPIPGAHVRASFRPVPSNPANEDEPELQSYLALTDRAGRTTFFVPRGSEVALLATTQGATPATKRVVIPKSKNEADVVVALSSVAYGTGLRINVGEATARTVFPMDVEATSPSGISHWSGTIESPDAEIPLAPGAYHLTLTSRVPVDGASGPPRWHPARLQADVSPGHVAVVGFNPKAASYVTLQIARPGRDEGGPPPGELPPLDPMSPPGYRTRFTRGTQTVEHETHALFFPGTFHVALSPGTWTYVSVFDDYETQRGTVVVRDGKATKVPVSLVDKK